MKDFSNVDSRLILHQDLVVHRLPFWCIAPIKLFRPYGTSVVFTQCCPKTSKQNLFIFPQNSNNILLILVSSCSMHEVLFHYPFYTTKSILYHHYFYNFGAHEKTLSLVPLHASMPPCLFLCYCV